MPQAQSKGTTDWSWVQADFCQSYIEVAEHGGGRENLQQIKDLQQAFMQPLPSVL